jgi:hypothetical protein
VSPAERQAIRAAAHALAAQWPPVTDEQREGVIRILANPAPAAPADRPAPARRDRRAA